MPAYTWTTGEVITAAKLQALENEAWSSLNILAVGTTTAEQSSFSSSYVDIAPSVSFTPQTPSVLVAVLGGGANHSSTNTDSYLGVRVNSVDYTISRWNPGSDGSSTVDSVAGAVLVTGLTPGTAYTAQTRLRTGGGTSYLVLGSDSRLTLIVLGIGK